MVVIRKVKQVGNRLIAYNERGQKLEMDRDEDDGDNGLGIGDMKRLVRVSYPTQEIHFIS